MSKGKNTAAAATTVEERRDAEFAKYREAYRDPNYRMGSTRQDAWMYWLYAEVTKHGYTSVLDVGCGRGEGLTIAKRGCGVPTVVGYEVIDYLCSPPQVIRIEGIHALPAADNSFDVVSCQDVMEHLLEEDVPLALSELVRVAKHRVFLSIAWFECQMGKRLGLDLHITMHPLEWWMDRINAAIPDGTVIANIGEAQTELAHYHQTATLALELP